MNRKIILLISVACLGFLVYYFYNQVEYRTAHRRRQTLIGDEKVYVVSRTHEQINYLKKRGVYATLNEGSEMEAWASSVLGLIRYNGQKWGLVFLSPEINFDYLKFQKALSTTPQMNGIYIFEKNRQKCSWTHTEVPSAENISAILVNRYTATQIQSYIQKSRVSIQNLDATLKRLKNERVAMYSHCDIFKN